MLWIFTKYFIFLSEQYLMIYIVRTYLDIKWTCNSNLSQNTKFLIYQYIKEVIRLWYIQNVYFPPPFIDHFFVWFAGGSTFNVYKTRGVYRCVGRWVWLTCSKSITDMFIPSTCNLSFRWSTTLSNFNTHYHICIYKYNFWRFFSFLIPWKEKKDGIKYGYL